MGANEHLALLGGSPEIRRENIFIGGLSVEVGFLDFRFRSQFAGRPPTFVNADPSIASARMHQHNLMK